MQRAQCDKKGRIYLKEALRSRYGERFVIIETHHGLVFVPVPSDLVADLAELGKQLPTDSIETIKKRIRRRAVREAGA